MHILGLQGMSRRIYTYGEGYGFDLWNKVATIGAFILASSVLLFVFNIFYSKVKAKSLPPVGPDPWDARTIEWMTPSPVPEYNFDPIPTITRVDDFWHRKYGETKDGKLVRIAETEEVTQKLSDGNHIHLPSPSYWPIVVAFGLPIVGLRPDLQPVAVPRRRRHRRRRPLRLGARAAGRPRRGPHRSRPRRPCLRRRLRRRERW